MKSIVLALLLCAFGASAQTALLARVQIDLTTANRNLGLSLSNALTVATATNAPLVTRTTPPAITSEPGGLFRVHALLEFSDFQKATNLFALTRLQQNPGLSGRIIIYCQPEELTRLNDWAGADRDPRAKRTEIEW